MSQHAIIQYEHKLQVLDSNIKERNHVASGRPKPETWRLETETVTI
jgi:hypothetical protein